MKLKKTHEFIAWYESQSLKERAQAENRLGNIEEHGHFGVQKDLCDFLSELKWGNGRRVYYSLLETESGDLILLLLGGNKNGQNSDIKKARNILKKHIQS